MISANMDKGATDFQLEAAISKVYASVSRLQRAMEAFCDQHSLMNLCIALWLIQFSYPKTR